MHPASPREVLDRFGAGSAQRKALAPRVTRVYRIARGTDYLERFVVFGSFVTDRPDPQDVDVFMIMANTFDASSLRGDARLLFDHGAAQAHFGATVFWVRRLVTWPDEQAAVEFWQVIRGGDRWGIVAITAEA